MPKPRKPTNLLHLTGAFARNPGRYADRVNEPKPSGPVGEPPDWFNKTQRESWFWILARCTPGTLGNSDEGILELTAVLRADVMLRKADGRTRTLLRQCYAELGMTPASRSKVPAKPDERQPNAFTAV